MSLHVERVEQAAMAQESGGCSFVERADAVAWSDAPRSTRLALRAQLDGEPVGCLLATRDGRGLRCTAIVISPQAPTPLVCAALIRALGEAVGPVALADCEFPLRRADLAVRQMLSMYGFRVAPWTPLPGWWPSC